MSRVKDHLPRAHYSPCRRGSEPPPVSVETSFLGRMIFCAEAVPEELGDRAVRLVAEHRDQYETEYAAIRSIAAKLGIATPESLRKWVRQASADHRDGRIYEKRGDRPAIAGHRREGQGSACLAGRQLRIRAGDPAEGIARSARSHGGRQQPSKLLTRAQSMD
jgi:hypothetical protein